MHRVDRPLSMCARVTMFSQRGAGDGTDLTGHRKRMLVFPPSVPTGQTLIFENSTVNNEMRVDTDGPGTFLAATRSRATAVRLAALRGLSSVGRAAALQAAGQGFDSPSLHSPAGRLFGAALAARDADPSPGVPGVPESTGCARRPLHGTALRETSGDRPNAPTTATYSGSARGTYRGIHLVREHFGTCCTCPCPLSEGLAGSVVERDGARVETTTRRTVRAPGRRGAADRDRCRGAGRKAHPPREQASVAQRQRHSALTRGVVGSSPTGGTGTKKLVLRFGYISRLDRDTVS